MPSSADSPQRESMGLSSLRVRLLLMLAAIQTVFVAAAVVGLGAFLTDFLHREAETETASMGQVVKSALRQQMLGATSDALEGTVADLGTTGNIRRIWIIDKTGRVVHAGDRAAIGRTFDRTSEPICTACHAVAGTRVRNTSFTTTAAGPVIRHVDTIVNERACWGCHDSRARLNGVIVLEATTRPLEDAVATVRGRLLGTGGLALAALLAGTFFGATVLVVRPVRRLAGGVRQLALGDLKARVPVTGRGELTELSRAFNSMAEDIDRSIQEIREKNAELTVVYSILERVARSIDLRQLQDIVLQTFIEVLHAEQAVLVSRETGDRAIKVLARSSGVTRMFRAEGSAPESVALPAGFPSGLADRWLQDGLTDPFIDGDRRVVAVGIRSASDSHALLAVRRAAPFSEAEANPRLLGLIGVHTAVAFDNARLYTLAITDELTRLFTVRRFRQQLGDLVGTWERDRRPFSVLLIDLDDFKAVNDRDGHPAGDLVLKAAARSLLDSIRVTDNGYRYGGDEFTVLLPDASLVVAHEVAERIRQAIEAMEVEVAPARNARITVSIGVAACPDDGTDADALVAAADAGLYEAKRAGRNRTAHAVDRAERP